MNNEEKVNKYLECWTCNQEAGDDGLIHKCKDCEEEIGEEECRSLSGLCKRCAWLMGK